jgi:hypothetical protein
VLDLDRLDDGTLITPVEAAVVLGLSSTASVWNRVRLGHLPLPFQRHPTAWLLSDVRSALRPRTGKRTKRKGTAPCSA